MQLPENEKENENENSRLEQKDVDLEDESPIDDAVGALEVAVRAEVLLQIQHPLGEATQRAVHFWRRESESESESE